MNKTAIEVSQELVQLERALLCNPRDADLLSLKRIADRKLELIFDIDSELCTSTRQSGATVAHLISTPSVASPYTKLTELR